MEAQAISIDIAGIVVQIQLDSKTARERLGQEYSQFVTHEPASVQIEVIKDPTIPGGASLDIHVELTQDHLIVAGEFIKGEYHLTTQNGKVWVTSTDYFGQLGYFLRILYGWLAFQRGGLLFHTAAIVYSQHSYLFFGPSGSGKTTAARVSEGKLVMNDDLVVLLPDGTGWNAYATPFWNPTQMKPTNCSAPVAGLYRLVQAPAVRCTPMAFGKAVAEVLACVPVLPALPTLASTIVQRCIALVTSVPVYRLEFLPDASFWPRIQLRSAELI